jgi:hypothetical protein
MADIGSKLPNFYKRDNDTNIVELRLAEIFNPDLKAFGCEWMSSHFSLDSSRKAEITLR